MVLYVHLISLMTLSDSFPLSKTEPFRIRAVVFAWARIEFGY